ncbi:MAG: hypothetical protein ACETV1_04905 [Candidatus Bathyarchaeia archaeon]
MNKARFLLRIGICIIIIGATIVFANITAGGGFTGSGNFRTPPNGTYVELVTLRNRPYEIRIKAPKAFKGTLYLFNYEGIRRLAEGTRTSILEETIKGSTLIDYTINRRGAYLILIESHVPNQTEGSLGLVEKEALSQDMMWDSGIIITIGIATTILALIPKITRLRS